MEDNNTLNNNVDDIPKIRTFQSDIADAIKNQKGSIVRIAVAEQERKQQEGVINQNQNKQNGLFIVAGIFLLLIAGGIFGWYVYTEKQKKEETIVNIPQKKNFIKGDHTTEILITTESTTKETIKKAIDGINIPVAQIEQFLIITKDEKGNKSQVPLETILPAFFIETPQNFFFSLVENTYLLGVYQDTDTQRFLLLRTKVFSNTFSQMLTWEPYMAKSFKELLKLPLDENKQITFKDKTIKNEDVRVGYQDETEVIAYSFFGPKKEYILIAENSKTIRSLIERFSSKLIEQ